MDYLTILLLLSFSWAFVHFLISAQSSSKSGNGNRRHPPPGPRPFPIIGNILVLGSNPHRSLAKLSKIHGPIMTLKLGSRTTIVISSPDIAKEVLKEKDSAFSSRTIPDTARAIDHHKFSMAWLPASAKWRSLRRVCATKIFSSQQLDNTRILRERKVKELLDYVGESCKNGKALDISEAVFTTVLNSLSNSFFSVDLVSHNSDSSQEFKDIVWNIMELLGSPNIVDFFPILHPFDPQGDYAKASKYFKKMIETFDGIIDERMHLRTSQVNYNDVLDSFLNLIEEESYDFTRIDMLHLFIDLFLGGTDTTSITVQWAMAELVSNPEKLEKTRKELQQVLGKDGKLEESDITRFPYLQAVVKETLRLHPPGPFLVPHKSVENVEIQSFTVPKNAQILVNVWAIGRDSSIWPDPDLFVPERFLDSGIELKGNDFRLIPFGAGRRICPGLSYASRSVPFILASLLNSYDWKLANGSKPDMTEKFGLSLKMAHPIRIIPVKA